MSEVELSMFRQRSQEAIRQKARRGEYFTRIAEGYVLGEGDRLEKDPDERVQRTIGLAFEKFRELGSARQVQLTWFYASPSEPTVWGYLREWASQHSGPDHAVGR
jgi:DNA invertase Pin-like site-specific DNA recombinase